MPQDKNVALALIEEVGNNVNQVLGNQIAMSFDVDHYDSKRDIFCGKMVKQCELAEKKSDDEEVLAASYILKAQLYGCWQKPQGVRGTHKKAEEFYEKALKLPGVDKARLYYRFALFCKVSPGRKQKAIDNFKQAIALAEKNSELGIECAKELAKEQEKKGGCFIATAVYDSYYAPEVMALREFRDKVLQTNFFGKMFIKIYYLISPPIADFIAQNKTLKRWVGVILIDPIVKWLRR